MQVSFEKTLEQLSLTPEDVERAKEKIMHTQGPERHLFDKIEQLKQICEEQKTQIHESLQEHREEVKIVQEELEDESVRARRRKGKFKRTGSKKGWLPS
jgi:gas vesicle protein